MNNRNDNNSVLLISSNSAFVGVELSNEKLDALFNTIHQMDLQSKTELARQVSLWMDSYHNYPMIGGFGHRILHGHSFLDIKDVYEQFGTEGIKEWVLHNSLDLTSKDGLPLPFAKELFELIPGVNIHDAIKWLCFNVTDLLAASFAGIALFDLYQKERLPSTFAVDGIIKTISGVLTGNPILIIIGSMTLISSVIGFTQGEEGVDIVLLLDDFSNISDKINALHLDVPRSDIENFKNI